MTEWRIEVNDGEELLTQDDGLYNVEVVDNLNPFGGYATAWFDDLDGDLFDLLPRATKVSFQYDSDETNGFEQRFVGFVVNAAENDDDGAEQLEVEAYTFDQFLRGDEVSNDQTGNTVFEALEDVITTDVPPVEWNPANVEVVDDVELTQSFQGDKVEDFLFALRKKSGGELPAVNEDLEFEWGPVERERTRRDIDNSEWIDHDIGEESGETKNQVTVVYNDGDSAIGVDESGDQLEIQDNLGAVGPGQEGETITRPEITNIEDAIDAGEQFLERREATITGTVTTFDLVDATPGQVIGVEIDPRGIDEEFRIAENKINWIGETNELTLVAKKGADDDILIEQSKTLKRVENRPRDADVIPDRVTDTKPTAEFSVSADADGTSADVTRMANGGLNRVRDAFQTQDEIQSLELQFSTSDSRPSRSDTTIDDVVASETPTVTTDPQSVTYGASTSASGIRTVGIRDSTEDVLLAVARLENAVDAPSVDLTIDLANDTSSDNTLWTDTGLNLIRDVLASVQPDWPEDYAYGSDDSKPDETNTSLNDETTRASLTEILIQEAFSDSGFEDITDIEDTEPFIIDGGALRPAQSAYFIEGNDLSITGDSFSDPDYSNGFARTVREEGQIAERVITPEYTIPADDVRVQVRNETIDDDTPAVEYRLNGEQIESFATGHNLPLSWGVSPFLYDGDDLEAGEDVLFEAEATDDNGGQNQDRHNIDCVVVYDNRFNHDTAGTGNDFDNDVNEPDGYLDDPTLFAAQETLTFDPDYGIIELETATTRRNVTEGSFTSTWNDTSANQFVELANDGSTFNRINNSDSGSVTFADAESSVDTRLGFSRIGTRTDATPLEGFDTQEISSWNLFADPDAIFPDDIATALVRAIIPANDAVGNTFAECGLIDESDTLLTHSRIPSFTKQEQLVISSERLRLRNDPEN